VGSSGNPPSLEKAEAEYVEVAQSEPLSNECQHFVDVVGGNVVPLTNGKEGLDVLKVLSAATLSQRKNGTVRIENL